MSSAPQTFYELLELDPGASKEEVRRAFELAKRTFAEGSLASYSLFGEEERKELWALIEEAYRVLIDDRLRREYDRQIGLIPSEPGNPSGAEETLEAATETEAGVLSPEVVTGKLLREVRERRGILLQEIARATKINPVYLQYIEEDNYGALPQDVYLRSYLGQYARYLGIDSKTVVEGYLKQARGASR